VSDEPTITPPNRTHMAGLLLGAACAVLTGVATVLLMGAGSPSAEAAALAIASGTLLMAWPAAISLPMPILRWGAMLIAGSSLRLASIVLMGVLLASFVDVVTQAFWLGIAVGGMTLLAVETTFLIIGIQSLKPALAGRGGSHA